MASGPEVCGTAGIDVSPNGKKLAPAVRQLFNNGAGKEGLDGLRPVELLVRPERCLPASLSTALARRCPLFCVSLLTPPTAPTDRRQSCEVSRPHRRKLPPRLPPARRRPHRTGTSVTVVEAAPDPTPHRWAEGPKTAGNGSSGHVPADRPHQAQRRHQLAAVAAVAGRSQSICLRLVVTQCHRVCGHPLGRRLARRCRCDRGAAGRRAEAGTSAVTLRCLTPPVTPRPSRCMTWRRGHRMPGLRHCSRWPRPVRWRPTLQCLRSSAAGRTGR